MTRVRLGMAAAIAALAAAAASSSQAARSCGSVTVEGTRYPVRIVSGEVGCAEAVSTLRGYIADAVATEGWSCARGHFGQPYAARCARTPEGEIVVEALNPEEVAAPASVRRGASLDVTASGLDAGRYTLTLVADKVPARGVRCLANVGAARRRAQLGWVRFRGRVPRRLRCYQGAGTSLGAVPAHAGAYHLVVGVKVAPAAWNADRSYLRRQIRVR